MKLKLHRYECGKVTTVGSLSVDGNAECFVIEDQDRQLELDPTAKIPGETCIPRGTYKVIVTWSNRFNRELPLLVDVPGYSGVRIHPGNSEVDSAGCLLPATSVAKRADGSYVGVNSREAFRRLFDKIEAADDVEIEIL